MGYFIEDLGAAGRASNRRADPRGLLSGTASAAAVDATETALESMLSYFGDPLQALDAAIAADPAWAHPHTLKAALLLTMAEHDPACDARGTLDAAVPLLAGATERERAHHAAASAAARGDWDRACALWDEVLVRWPRDVAALLFAHLFDFYRGDALNLKRRPQRALPHWSGSEPLHGFVLGMFAFGLEESGHYGQAEDTGLAALAANPRDPWAVHAVVHVHEMEGRHEQGAAFLAGRHADWAVDNGLAFHNWFHVALFQLEAMDTAAALRTFDAYLATATDTALQRVDGTAILWRLKLLGVDVGDRFTRLRDRWHRMAPQAGFYAFNDVHALLASAGSGDAAWHEDAVSLFAALGDPASGGPANRRMSSAIGVPLAAALAAHARGDWEAAARILLQVRDHAHGFGGSHAQRDILTQMLLDAAVRSGDAALARHVLHERLPAKHETPLTEYWRARIAG